MRRRDAMKAMGTIAGAATLARLLPGCARSAIDSAVEQDIDVYPPNFGLLASDNSWRNSWGMIIPGRFSSSPYSGLLFVEQSTGYAEVYNTSGQGGLVAPALATYQPIGGRASWTHIVPGIFGAAGYTGLVLYDRAAGAGAIYDCDGHGHFTLLHQYTGWRTSWTQIVTGRFVVSSPFSSILFYSASENYAEIWATNGSGLTGSAPYATFPNFSAAQTRWTHLVAADFHWTPAFILTTPTLTDLFCYDTTTGAGQMFRFDLAADGTSRMITPATTTASGLPLGATSVVAGNFGGLGNSDLVFLDGPGGMLRVYSFQDAGDTAASLVLRETLSGVRTSIAMAVPGNFWMADCEDHWFGDGPPTAATAPFNNAFDPDWRFGTGGFSDLVLYDREAGLGQFYYHEPLLPDVEQLAGYITSRTTHGSTSGLSTGSVLPGEQIDIHVSSQIGRYQIELYQETWLPDGRTEQLMTVVDGPTTGQAYPVARSAYRNGAAWPVAVSFVIPSAPRWPSGVYIARIRSTVTPSIYTDVPFVVRAPAPSQTRVLLVIDDMTFQAYNDWGGRSVYGHVSGFDPATRQATLVGAYPSTSALRVPFGFQLSFERPYRGGFGNVIQSWEIPFVRWLARQGIGVDVCTSRDLHFEAPALTNHRLLLFVGHHEYWTGAMRDSVENFAAGGGNVAFFAGNVCWWQVRLSSDGSQLTCYKVAGFDPLLTTSPGQATVHWFDDPVKRPETRLTGVSWNGSGVFYDANHRYQVSLPGHWVFTGTGLAAGAQFGGYIDAQGNAASVAGPETDRVQAGGPNGLSTPAGYKIAGIVDPVDEPGNPLPEQGAMGVFSPPGGTGTVFNAATMNWALGLARDANTWSVIDRITSNVVNGLRTAWRPWSSVSDGRAGTGVSIRMVPNGDGRFALFLADPSGGVYTTLGSATAGWSGWSSVSQGSAGPGVSITAVPTGNGQFALFLADPAGGVYTAWGHPTTGWSGWSSVSQGSAGASVSITAVPNGDGRFALFLADPGGGVYTAIGSGPGGWSGWSSVSQGSAGTGTSVTAAPTGDGRFAVFVADPGGGVYTATGHPATGWTGWSNVSQGTAGPHTSVTVQPIGGGRFALFLADPGGGIYTASGNAQSGWSPWSSVSQGIAAPRTGVTAAPYGDGRFALFLADPGSGIYTASGNAQSGWSPWTSVAGGRAGANTAVSASSIGGGQFEVVIADPTGAVLTTYGPQ